MKISKSFFRSLSVILASVLALGAGLGLYVYYLHVSLKSELQSYLTQVAAQNVKILDIQFGGNFKSLQSVAAALSTYGETNNHQWAPLLEEETRRNGYKRMGIARPNGVASLSDDFLINLSGQPHFETAMAGKPAVSDLIADSVDQQEIMVMTVPIFSSGTVSGVLFATLPAGAYNNLLLAESFDAEGYSLVAKANGDKVMVSRNAKTDPKVNNIFQTSLNQELDLSGRMRRNMEQGKGGAERFYRAGQGWLNVSYKPVGINDWFLLSVVPERVATQKTKNLLWLSLILCGTGLIVFIFLLGYIYFQNKRARAVLYHAAYTDSVTGRPNWTRARQQIAELLHNTPAPPYAFVVFDVNKFKVANDRLGYPKANELLHYISDTLAEEIKKDELAVRVQADIFAMLLRMDSPEQLRNRLELLNEKIVNFSPAASERFQLILSFGVFPMGNDRLSAQEMLLRASLARNTVKGNYNDIVAFYDETLRERINQEQSIENDMEKALDKREFSLVLTPVRTMDGQLAAAQGVAAWNPPGKTAVPEQVFLKVFAKNGFITRLDTYMAEEACRLLQHQMKENKDCLPILLDVSMASLRSPYFSSVLRNLTRRYDVFPSNLVLQLTPLAEPAELPLLKQLSERLHGEGFKLALNHFGRGTVSLELIEALPIDMIKMESVFLNDLAENPRTRQILRAFIDMAKTLQLRMIFDGVTTDRQLLLLKELGADLFEGPLAGTPVSAEELCRPAPDTN